MLLKAWDQFLVSMRLSSVSTEANFCVFKTDRAFNFLLQLAQSKVSPWWPGTKLDPNYLLTLMNWSRPDWLYCSEGNTSGPGTPWKKKIVQTQNNEGRIKNLCFDLWATWSKSDRRVRPNLKQNMAWMTRELVTRFRSAGKAATV